MSLPIGLEELQKLKTFIALCSSKPEILNLPQLDFFKSFIEKLGGKIPSGEFKIPSFETDGAKTEANMNDDKKDAEEKDEDSSSESELELDETGIIEPDNDEPQPMGDPNKEVTEEEMDEASEYRGKAAKAYSEGKYQEAIDLYTKAIELFPNNALFHAKRGQAFLKLQKPKACIRDCERALELNCDSAAAYKYRGRANRLLGNWELAAKDLRQACKIDFDEEADEWLKEVTPNALKIEQHRIRQERKKAEKELKKRQERLRKAQEENKKAQQENQQRASSGGGAGAGAGRGGGMPNLGNLFGNLDQSEILSAFSDPEISAAMQDIMTNPANISKYQTNPKVMNLMGKLASSMGGGAGGFPGAASGFPGFGETADSKKDSKPKPKPDFTDDGLD